MLSLPGFRWRGLRARRDRRPQTHLTCAVLTTLWLSGSGVVPSHAQSLTPEEPRDEDQALEQFGALSQEFKQLGEWEPNAELIRSAVERVWRENGWNSESDRFARRSAEEISSIPPWDFQGRIEKLTDLLGERYQFDERQRQRLQSSVYAEAGWFMVRNFRTVMDQTRETIRTRAQGRPFTPEMVAKWTRESDDLLADARERLDRVVKSMEKTMTPEQRRLLREDLKSYERRRGFVDQVREKWARGEWRPEDWGLDRDPIHAQGTAIPPGATSRPADREIERPPDPNAVLAYDETTWERYVREFIAHYALDDAQREAARSVLRELQARAGDYRQTHREELSGVAPGESEHDPVTVPIRRMFGELKARLQPIPTSAQRAAAGPTGP